MRISLSLVVLGCLLASGIRAAAQDAEAPRPGRLRAELSLDRDIYYPSQPIFVRFTLFNPAAEAVELSVPALGSEGDEIALPPDLIFGRTDRPTLFLNYEKEAPVAIQPNAKDLPGGGDSRVLRVAPKAALGVEIDLAALHRQLRYSGQYRLEWRPFGDEAAAAVSFRVEKRLDAILITDHGRIKFHLYYDEAPRNVANFVDLARSKFYDQKTFHRIIPGFLLQGGSPDKTNKGVRPDGKLMPAEFRDVPFELGTLAMARKPKDPDSASCQFFVSLGRNPQLDGQFTVIGQAYDEESFRTLQTLSELPVDAKDRPVQPLTIRFITLVDAQTQAVSESIK
jgi:cyclophilin family peptidyl-prolyl cis-trans isomerase